MPRGRDFGGSSKGEVRRSQLGPITDFTLYDFAHSEASSKVNSSSVRVRKGAVNALSSEVKRLQQINSAMDVAWYEKDLEDFNDVSDPINDEIGYYDPECFDENQILNHKVEVTNEEEALVEGRVYPIDLWCMIGRYIQPEDVGRFARLCKNTYRVTHTAQFWQNLYKRHYTLGTNLPEGLDLSMIDRVHGLRHRVIRALHYMHPPFTSRTSRLCDVEPQVDGSSLVTLDSLLGSTCINQYYELINGVYHFCWKLRRYGRGLRAIDHDQMLLADPDVMYNSDEGYVMLEMVCPGFVLQPPVSGLVLVDVETSAGQGLSSQGCVVRSYALGHRVRLTFNQRYTGARGRGKRRGMIDVKTGSSAVECVVDPAVHIDVIHWWSKSYRKGSG